MKFSVFTASHKLLKNKISFLWMKSFVYQQLDIKEKCIQSVPRTSTKLNLSACVFLSLFGISIGEYLFNNKKKLNALYYNSKQDVKYYEHTPFSACNSFIDLKGTCNSDRHTCNFIADVVDKCISSVVLTENIYSNR